MSKRKDEPRGSMLPLPLQFLAAWLAVWPGRVLQQEVDYLTAENRVLREKLGGRKLRLTDAERCRRAGRGTGAQGAGEHPALVSSLEGRQSRGVATSPGTVCGESRTGPQWSAW